MINKIIILILIFFILIFALHSNYESFQVYGGSGFNFDSNVQNANEYYSQNYLQNQNQNYLQNQNQQKEEYCETYTNDAACDSKSGCYYDYTTNNCNNIQTNDNDNCHLSVAKYTCVMSDGCKWINGKCKSSKDPQTCGEIKNEYDCNNSSLNCLYDNSSYKCYDQLFEKPENEKDRIDYDYSDRDCKTLRKRGHNVYCTYDESSIEDESLYFNIDKVIDVDKKRYKTCYGSNCNPIQITQSVIDDSGCSSSKNRITCDMQDQCEYINYKCVRKE